MIIADANVITYLMVPTSFSTAAAELLEREPEWSAPRIWQQEVLNALTKYVREKKLTLEEAMDAFSTVRVVVASDRTNWTQRS